MRIIFMGTPDFATGTLQALYDAGHEIVLAVTQPDKPAGRGKNLQSPPVKVLARELGIPVYQPEKVRDPEALDTLRTQKADIMVVVAFGQILPKEVLEMTPYGCINVHASLLPAWRGAAPIQWSILAGDKVTGVTTMQMDEGLDTGDMLLQKEIAIEPDETGGSLFDKLAQDGAALCVETLAQLEAGTVKPVPQGKTTTPYAKMLDKKMGRIDWSKPAAEIERLIRGLSPWPGAYTFRGDKMLKIKKAALGSTPKEKKKISPGGIAAEKGRLFVRTGGKGWIEITELQPAGKRSMTADEYLRGKPAQAGEALG